MEFCLASLWFENINDVRFSCFSFNDQDKGRVNEYLAHSGKVADRHYRQLTNESIAKAADILENLALKVRPDFLFWV